MYNPLCLLSSELLAAFVSAGQNYYVRQTFARGENPNNNATRAFLISHYSDYKQALEHFEAVAADRNLFMYLWSEPTDRKRLQLAATQPNGFRIYASVVMPGWEVKAENLLKTQVRNYMERKNLWQAGRKDEITFELYPHFGEVFVRMRFRKQIVKVSLDEVEKYE